MTKLLIICAWCGMNMGTKPGQGQTGVSHGICDECIEKELKKLKDGVMISACPTCPNPHHSGLGVIIQRLLQKESVK